MSTKNPFAVDDEAEDDSDIFAPSNTDNGTQDDPFSMDSPSLFASDGNGAGTGRTLDGGDMGSSSNADLAKLQRENKLLKEALRLKEEEVTEKDAELRRKELEVARYRPAQLEPNWPVCCPRLRHNIAEDIPEEQQFFARLLYFVWMLTQGTLLLNWITLVLLLGIFCSVNLCTWYPVGQDVLLSFVYIVILAPVSIFFWYRPVYNALRTWERSTFYTFFPVFFAHIVFVIISLAGPIGSGSAGITLLSILLASRWDQFGVDKIGSSDSTAGAIVFCLILVIICVCLWFIDLVASCYCMRLAYLAFKSMNVSAGEIRAAATVASAAPGLAGGSASASGSSSGGASASNAV